MPRSVIISMSLCHVPDITDNERLVYRSQAVSVTSGRLPGVPKECPSDAEPPKNGSNATMQQLLPQGSPGVWGGEVD
jgi:hypothetical protein